MKTTLSQLLNHNTLSVTQSEQVMDKIMQGDVSDAELASFLSFLRFRGETTDEITGFVKSLRKHSVKLEGCDEAIDTCGTGGDQASTFNISTASAILLSAAGVKVAKHGNRAVSSKSGSRDVLDVLGIPTESTPEQAASSLENMNMCFLFAPLYHQSMQHAMNVRKSLGFRTIFNFLGPLINPIQCTRQVIGVSDVEMAKKMAQALQSLGTDKTLIVTGKDGLDELSIHGENTIIEIDRKSVKTYTLQPEELGMNRGRLSSIQVKDAFESAKKIEAIFQMTADEDSINTLIINAAAGFYVSGYAESLIEGVDKAKETLKSGKGYQQLETLKAKSEVRSYA